MIFFFSLSLFFTALLFSLSSLVTGAAALPRHTGTKGHVSNLTAGAAGLAVRFDTPSLSRRQPEEREIKN